VHKIKNIGYERLRTNGFKLYKTFLRARVIGFLNVGMKLCNLYEYMIFRSIVQDTSMNHETVVGFEVFTAVLGLFDPEDGGDMFLVNVG
jgi:hypothetical protein